MADINEIFKKGIRFGAVGRVNSKQIDQAADRLIQAGAVSREILEQREKDIARDRLLFMDVDQMNKMLKRMKKPGVAKEETSEDTPRPCQSHTSQ